MTVIIIIFLVATFYGLGQQLTMFQEWVRSFGLWSPFIFFCVYLAAVIAAFPGTALGIIAGTLFGALFGTILISIASTIGSALTFLIARYIARASVTKWVSKHETFQRLDVLTETYGAGIVAITRLIPLFPFNLLNYAFGLTKIKFWTYIFWSWLCMLPATIVVVGTADAVAQGITAQTLSWQLIGSILGAGIVLVLVTWYARIILRKKEPSSGKP